MIAWQSRDNLAVLLGRQYTGKSVGKVGSARVISPVPTNARGDKRRCFAPEPDLHASPHRHPPVTEKSTLLLLSCFHKAEIFLSLDQKKARAFNGLVKPLQSNVHLVSIGNCQPTDTAFSLIWQILMLFPLLLHLQHHYIALLSQKDATRRGCGLHTTCPCRDGTEVRAAPQVVSTCRAADQIKAS